jgi:DNA invertase Pin-like site-specific DNA recombinase
LFAEIERDLVAERMKEGCAAARKGKQLGRPKGALGTSNSRAVKPTFRICWRKPSRKRPLPRLWGSPGVLYTILSAPVIWRKPPIAVFFAVW